MTDGVISWIIHPWRIRMPFKIVILWTDTLVFLLVLSCFLFAIWARKQQLMISAWHEVKKRRLGMAAMVIVIAYAIIGILDSMHYRLAEPQAHNGKTFYSTQVYSVLDKLLYPIGQQDEKTFSAPFALRSFSKEVVNLDDGTQVRIYPRLKYGGAHLEHEEDRGLDILYRTLWGGFFGALLWMMSAGIFWKKLKHQKPVLITLGFLFIVIPISVYLARYYHILGTDKVGQDIFYASVKSIRTGLIIGTVTTLVMLPFAIFLGSAAGYFSGWIDDAIQYVYTTLSSIPGVLLITASILSLQVFIGNHPQFFPTLAERADARLLSLCIILGVTSWTGLCRLLRAETLKVREMDFVLASKAMGVMRSKIIFKHILPNIMHIVLITIVLDFSGLVLAEAVLSYVGVGVDPTTLSWGNLINSARLDLAREPIVWWPLVSAFVFMFLLVLSANLFADAVRDAFDPRIRHEQ